MPAPEGIREAEGKIRDQHGGKVVKAEDYRPQGLLEDGFNNEPEDFGVRPGIDYPATLGPAGDSMIRTEEQTMTQLNALTNELTAFTSFEDMLNAEGGYRPSFYVQYDPRFRELADAYDKAQEERGDPRRAYRGGKGW